MFIENKEFFFFFFIMKKKKTPFRPKKKKKRNINKKSLFEKKFIVFINIRLYILYRHLI
jgi:hypothetical protein